MVMSQLAFFGTANQIGNDVPNLPSHTMDGQNFKKKSSSSNFCSLSGIKKKKRQNYTPLESVN